MEKIKKKKEVNPEVDPLKKLYYELKDKLQSDGEWMSRDITQLFMDFLKDKILNKELINLNISGEVGTGKSTSALEFQRRTNKIIETKFKKKITNFKWIASDQNEFLRLSRTSEENLAIVIDEWNAFARTGANATLEEAEYEFFSDLCRIQYLHRIICSPMNVMDKNCMILLDVLGLDRKEKITIMRVSYRNTIEGMIIPLGIIRLDVSETIKSTTYKKYENKKRQRVELLRKHGIRDIRELEFAKVSLEIVESLQDMARQEKVTIALIKTKAQNIMRKTYKRSVTMIAEDEIVKPSYAILDNMNTIKKAKSMEAKKIIKEVTEEMIQNLQEKKEILKVYQNI